MVWGGSCAKDNKLTQAVKEISHVGHLSASGMKHPNKDWLPTAPAKYTLAGHWDKVNAVSFHLVYSICASTSGDATVKIWDWESGELEQTLKSHTKSVIDYDFDSTGKNLGGHTFLAPLCEKPSSSSLIFNPATASYNLLIKLWNVNNEYKNFATLRGHEHSISSVRFLLGDNHLASSSRDHSVRIWDVQTTCIQYLNVRLSIFLC
jgi:platelet-activating factor acetylhydrolase IB subunit alpha